MDPTTLQEIRDHWRDTIKTGVNTFSNGLPMDGLSKDDIQKILTKLADVSALLSAFITSFVIIV